MVIDALEDWTAYTSVEGGIYFVPKSDSKSGYSLRYLDTATGSIKGIASFEKPVRSASVSPDRRWLLYTQEDQIGSDLMLVENFH